MQLPQSVTLVMASLSCAIAPVIAAGPYSAALDDPANPHDAPVPGFTGPHGAGKARIVTGLDEDLNEIVINPDNFVNPLFFAWAESVVDYQPSDFIPPDFNDELMALGPVTGDHFWGIVSLGDMTAEEIDAGDPPGSITLQLSKPVLNLSGADFVVFENGYISGSNLGGAGAGGIFAELACVEVSADGENFVRFPSISLTPSPVGAYGSLDATDIYNLAGKHVNSYGVSWGTPFDLDEVGLAEITHVRIVDVPGNGAFTDSQGNPIHDPWRTTGSGGFDLEAVGGISTRMTYDEWPQLDQLDPALRGEHADPDGDGVPNLLEYAFARLPCRNDAGANLPSMQTTTSESGEIPEFVFIRDERLVDLRYEVQVSETAAVADWTTIAMSEGGAPLTPAEGHNPEIFETSASDIASIGVIRRVAVRHATSADKCFFRVKVRRIFPSPPSP